MQYAALHMTIYATIMGFVRGHQSAKDATRNLIADAMVAAIEN